jgi:hypothetical protein
LGNRAVRPDHQKGWNLAGAVANPNGRQIQSDAQKKEICTCPDFATNGGKCKHIYAVIFKTEYPKSNLVDPPPVVEPAK